MLDLEHAEFEIPCPACKFYNPILLKQVLTRATVICRGCHATLVLNDKNNEVRRGLKQIKDSLDDLERAFRSFGRR
jgi:hypothetical protein